MRRLTERQPVATALELAGLDDLELPIAAPAAASRVVWRSLAAACGHRHRLADLAVRGDHGWKPTWVLPSR